MTIWAGVDVGAARKGFHVAAVDSSGLVQGPEQIADVDQVVSRLVALDPAVVALDSPRSYAAPGATRREAERAFAARKICGIRWTPDHSRVLEAHTSGSTYYDWILNGRALYDALSELQRGWEVIECFPTASWSVWAGPRVGRRTTWSRKALEELDLTGAPVRRLNQDDRDAIAAALTARLYAEQGTETFGDELVIPTRSP